MKWNRISHQLHRNATESRSKQEPAIVVYLHYVYSLLTHNGSLIKLGSFLSIFSILLLSKRTIARSTAFKNFSLFDANILNIAAIHCTVECYKCSKCLRASNINANGVYKTMKLRGIFMASKHFCSLYYILYIDSDDVSKMILHNKKISRWQFLTLSTKADKLN